SKARNSLPSKSSTASPSLPATLSTPFSRTANSSATKLSPKSAPLPHPKTSTTTTHDLFSENVARRRGHWPARLPLPTQLESLNFSLTVFDSSCVGKGNRAGQCPHTFTHTTCIAEFFTDLLWQFANRL